MFLFRVFCSFLYCFKILVNANDVIKNVRFRNINFFKRVEHLILVLLNIKTYSER